MKIAIPTNDKTTISSHFGRSQGFMIYQVNDQAIIQEKYLENTFTRHATGQYNEKHDHSNQRHSHENIFNSLGDCEVVIAGGMGRRLYDDFTAKNVQVYLTQVNDIELALKSYMNNELQSDPEGCCHH